MAQPERPAATAPGAPTQRQQRPRRWRLFQRAASGGAVGLFLLAAGAVSAWRWGLTPLPEPVAGGVWVLPSAQTDPELTPANYWYWVRELERTSNVNRRDDILHGWSVFEWAETGHLAETNRAALARFFGADPALSVCFQGALSETRADEAARSAPRRGRELLTHARLIRYAAWQASESEQAGRPAEALGHLLAGWRLCIRSGAPGLTRSELALLAKAWRRLALEGRPLEPAEGRHWLDQLAAIEEGLPSLESTFSQAVSTQYDLPYGRAGHPLSWREVGRRFGQALGAMAQETVSVAATFLGQLLGGRGPAPPSESRGIRGILHLGDPCDYLLQQLQQRVARPADLIQVRDAYVSRILAALRQGDEDRAQTEAAELQGAFWSHSLARRVLDRPAAWRSLSRYAPLRPLLDDARAARTTVESCRLVLALRLYRDRHGGWPESLSALVPEWLDRVPFDPHTRQPFRYEREGGGWLVHAAHEDARAPEPADDGILFHSAEPGEARLLRLISGQGRQLTGVMDVQLLQRYGLLPKGLAGFLSQMSTNQPLAQALSAMLPAVSDLRGLIRLGEPEPPVRPRPATPPRAPE